MKLTNLNQGEGNTNTDMKFGVPKTILVTCSISRTAHPRLKISPKKNCHKINSFLMGPGWSLMRKPKKSFRST